MGLPSVVSPSYDLIDQLLLAHSLSQARSDLHEMTWELELKVMPIRSSPWSSMRILPTPLMSSNPTNTQVTRLSIMSKYNKSSASMRA